MLRPWPDAILHPDARAVDALSMHTASLLAARSSGPAMPARHRTSPPAVSSPRGPGRADALAAMRDIWSASCCSGILSDTNSSPVCHQCPSLACPPNLSAVFSGNGPRTSNASGQPTFAVHSNFCIYPRLKHPHSLAFESGPSLSAPSAQEASRGAPVRLARPG
jgi:hypothetical protein